MWTTFENLSVQFELNIKKLRLVKFPKTIVRQLLQKELINPFNQEIETIFAISDPEVKTTLKLSSYKFLKEDIIVITKNIDSTKLKESIDQIINKAPLSKFGIEPQIFLERKKEFVKNRTQLFGELKLWLYSQGIVNKFNRSISLSEWVNADEIDFLKEHICRGVPPIISNICVNQDVKRTWESKEKKHTQLLSMYDTFSK